MLRSWENREFPESLRVAFDKGRASRIGTKDAPEIIEQRRASRGASEAKRREAGLRHIWINDGVNGKMIDASDPIPDGWSIGRQPSFAENAKANRKGEKRDTTARANMSASATSAWSNTEKREAMMSARRKFRWMTDGIISKKLFEGEELPAHGNWRFGRMIKSNVQTIIDVSKPPVYQGWYVDLSDDAA